MKKSSFSKTNFLFIALISIIFCGSLSTAQQQYQLTNRPDGHTGINVEIRYLLGIHHGEVTQAIGEASITNNFQMVTGKFTVPISALVTANPTRDCHLREALGLDYTQSHFPKEHVCNKQSELPQQGVDAVVFPNIEFTLVGVSASGDPATLLKPGSSFPITAAGQWSIHGVEKTVSMQLNATVMQNGVLNIKGDLPFLLTDFGVIVKPVAGIGVKNQMKVQLNIFLAPKAN